MPLLELPKAPYSIEIPDEFFEIWMKRNILKNPKVSDTVKGNIVKLYYEDYLTPKSKGEIVCWIDIPILSPKYVERILNRPVIIYHGVRVAVVECAKWNMSFTLRDGIEAYKARLIQWMKSAPTRAQRRNRLRLYKRIVIRMPLAKYAHIETIIFPPFPPSPPPWKG